MLDERKADVLKAVIEAYTETAQPVGSGAVEALKRFTVSSATIRNDMAYLEKEGYLRQPHTSAGRVPTQKGYRDFVDRLDARKITRRRQAKEVSQFFSQMRGEIEEVLHETAGLLSRLTDYAAVVVEDPEAPQIKSCQLVELNSGTYLVVFVLSNGHVLKHTIETSKSIDDAELAQANTALNSALVGKDLTGDLSLVAKPNSPAANLAKTAIDWLSTGVTTTDRVYVDGASRVVNAFEAVESVSKVLEILEQQLVVVSLLSDVTNEGVTVSIGAEHGVEPLANCSLVVSPYEIDGEQAGSIAVLGPTRMKYPQAISAVAAVSRQLGESLSEG